MALTKVVPLFLIVSLLSWLTQATLPPAAACVYGCNAVLYLVPLAGAFDECGNELWIQSQYYCATIYCSDEEIKAGLDYANESCALYGESLPSYNSIVNASVNLDQIDRISQADLSSSSIDHPIIPVQQFFDRGQRTVHAFYYNIWISYDFSYSLYGFWGLVVLIGLINRLVELLRSRISSDNITSRDHPRSLQARVRLWTRKNLIIPATFGQACQYPVGWCTIPPRLESLLLVLYVVLNVVYCFPGYDVFVGNLYYAPTSPQLTRYVADRTGILSIANVPVFWLFAARNDPLLWLTGWSFATYNRFHRWVARISTVQAVVHSIAFSVFSGYYGTFQTDWNDRYWWTGEVATIVMCLLLGASVYGLRRSHYDLFLVIHVVLAVVFLVMLFFHVKILGNIYHNEWNAFIWPCIAIWSLDRILRAARIVYVSLLPRALKGTKALATYDERTEMIRLDVSDFRIGHDPRPGIFYYIYAPGALQGYESHPFTLCTWQRKAASSPSPSSVSSLKGDGAGDEKVAGFRDRDHPESVAPEDVRHSFLVRPYEGFTSRVKTRVTKELEAQSSCQMMVLLEGPYGNSLDLSRFSNVLVIAGGSGIVAAVSHTHWLLKRGTTSVHVVWAVPQRHLVDDVCEHELGFALSNDRVTMDVYLTGSAPTGPSVLASSTPYKIHYGRPDLSGVMEDARRDCKTNLAIVESGTPAMSDACRRAFVQLLDATGTEVEFFSETMTW